MSSREPRVRERAAHIDADWLDEFVLELRLRGAGGAAIGDAIAEADADLAERGASAAHTFGNPREYARSLELPDTQRWTRAEAIRLVAHVAGIALGGLLLLAGVLGCFTGEAVISLGMLLAVVAMNAVLVLLLLARSEWVLRTMTSHPALSITAIAIFALLVVAASTALPAFVVTTAPWIPLALGATLLIGMAIAAGVRVRRHGGFADPIRFPAP